MQARLRQNCWAFAVACCFGWCVACQPSEADVGSSCDKLTCLDSDPCTSDECSPSGACMHGPVSGPTCSDGGKCLYAGTCMAGLCTGTPTNCSDGIPCTTDSCGPSECLHLAGGASTCDDANTCTGDVCVPQNGCIHQPIAGACADGSLCTGPDSCSGGVCAAGPATATCDDGNSCTVDTCVPALGNCQFAPLSGPCDDGNPCTWGDTCATGTCTAPVNCACAQAAGLPVTASEDCATPDDDNCDGMVNEASLCGPPSYGFSEAPQCGGSCYYDEAHNVAALGALSIEDPSGYSLWASGQLVDGIRGVDEWGANLGNGSAYEWVGWASAAPVITVKFAVPRKLGLVRLGLSNEQVGSVAQPPQVSLRLSMDGQTWAQPHSFSLAAATMPVIAVGKRADIALKIPLQVARFVEIAFATPGSWTFVDELEFD